MIFAFPYHNPKGVYNELFKKNLDLLEECLGVVCASVTPSTVDENADFLKGLSGRAKVFLNEEGSGAGDHFRNALKIALEVPGDEPIFFGFLDRVIFALESEWRGKFLEDLENYKKEEFLVFERTDEAWETHPSNYREIEQAVSRCFELLSGRKIELNPCGLLLSRKSAGMILKESTSPSLEVLGEWVLLALKNDLEVKTVKTDWLLWEDPFWEKKDPAKLKTEREKSREETVKRIKSNLPFLALMTEERFKRPCG